MEGGTPLLRRSPRFLATPSFPPSLSASSPAAAALSSPPPFTPMSAPLSSSSEQQPDFLDHSAFPPSTPAAASLSLPTSSASSSAAAAASSSGSSSSRSFLSLPSPGSSSLSHPSPSGDSLLLSPPLSALGAMGLMRAMNKNDSSGSTHSNATAMLRRRNSRRGSTATDSFSLLSQSPLQLSMQSPLLSFDAPSSSSSPHQSSSASVVASVSAAVGSPLDSPAMPALSNPFNSTPTVSFSVPATAKRATRAAAQQHQQQQQQQHYSSYLTSPSPPTFSHPLPRRSPRFQPSSSFLSSMQSPGLFASSPSFSFSLPSPSLSSLPSEAGRVKREEADDSLIPPSPLTSVLDPVSSPSSVGASSLSSPNRSIMRSIYSLSSGSSPSPPFGSTTMNGSRKRRRKSEDAKLSAMFPQFTPPLHPAYAASPAASTAAPGSAVSFNLLEMNGLSPAFHPLSAYSQPSSHALTNGHSLTPSSTPSSAALSDDSSYSVSGASTAVNGQSASSASDSNGLGSSCHQCKSRRSLSQLIFCCNMFASNSAARKQAMAAAAAAAAAATAAASSAGTSIPGSSASPHSKQQQPVAGAGSVTPVKVEKKGICRKKYCDACFSERDTRVLTNAGFLFLADIEARIDAGQQLLYACYDTSTQSIVYMPGRVVLVPPPTRWVDFTHSSVRRLWDATSDDYGSTVPASGAYANRLTPAHHARARHVRAAVHALMRRTATKCTSRARLDALPFLRTSSPRRSWRRATSAIAMLPVARARTATRTTACTQAQRAVYGRLLERHLTDRP